MSKPEPAAGELAAQDRQPPFLEQWQAQVMSLAFNLIERGQFSNAQWSEALGARLAEAARLADPDDAQTYYLAALAALEALLDEQQSVRTQTLDARTEAWRTAYLRTPHGQPVRLPMQQGDVADPDARA